MNPFKRKPKDPEIEAAYQSAYREERLKVAAERGKAKAHEKPFYQKLGSVVSGGSGKGGNFGKVLNEMAFGTPEKKKRKRKRRKK